jgi:hypothetical protein
LIMNRLFVALTLVLAAALPARAQQLKLDIKDGRVTLEATAVPARQILAAWAEIGGTKVVGAEKITGAPLTLKLAGVPERQALDIILRNVAGFMAAPRQASAAPGASGYDRIMILATTSATAPTAPASARTNASPANGPTGPGGRRLPPRPPNLQPAQTENSDGDEVQQEAEEQADSGAGTVQPVFTFPAPGSVNGVNGAPGNPVFVPVPTPNGRPGQPGVVTAPVIGLQPNANGQPTIYNFVPNTNPNAPPQPTPSGFTVIGSPQPGMIVQPPPPPPAQQQQQQRPPPNR